MWTMMAVTVGVFGLAFAGMALGLARGKELKGSCGGAAGSACLCSSGQQQQCELKKVKEAAERVAAERAAAAAHDA